MRNFNILLLGIFIPLTISAQVTETFFDFETFEDQIKEVYTSEQNRLYTENGRPIAEIGSSMFMLDNWSVKLNGSSGENPFSKRDSYTKKIVSDEQGTVLGVRIYFPEWPFSSEVHITPHFPLLPFQRTGEYANINNGVVTNVGIVKSFSMWANGRNFPFSLGIRVRDLKEKLTEFSLGSMLFVGWRKLSYEDPTYSARVINNILPPTRIYPSEVPLLHFDSLVLYRAGNKVGGDFVGYFGSSEIEYTPYLTDEITDIDDEMTWGIIRAKQEKIASLLNSTLYEKILQYEYARKRVALANEGNEEDEEQIEDAAQ